MFAKHLSPILAHLSSSILLDRETSKINSWGCAQQSTQLHRINPCLWYELWPELGELGHLYKCHRMFSSTTTSMVSLQHVQRCHLCAKHPNQDNQVAKRDIPTNFRVAFEDDTFLAGAFQSLELRPPTASTVGGMGEPAEAA